MAPDGMRRPGQFWQNAIPRRVGGPRPTIAARIRDIRVRPDGSAKGTLLCGWPCAHEKRPALLGVVRWHLRMQFSQMKRASDETGLK